MGAVASKPGVANLRVAQQCPDLVAHRFEALVGEILPIDLEQDV